MVTDISEVFFAPIFTFLKLLEWTSDKFRYYSWERLLLYSSRDSSFRTVTGLWVGRWRDLVRIALRTRRVRFELTKSSVWSSHPLGQ